MIKTIAAVGLPVDEVLEIRKNRIMPENPRDDMKRISVVTGIHGDELEGQYVCFELQRRIEQNKEYLAGIVDIYPAMNPLGIDSITRGIPAFDLDMNRLFPGDIDGSMMDYVVARIMEDVAGSDCVFDIHASNIYLTEIPQIRINELHQDVLVPMAEGTWSQYGVRIYLCIQPEPYRDSGVSSRNGGRDAHNTEIWRADGGWDFSADEEDGDLEGRSKTG